MSGAEEVLNRWTDSSAYWEKHRETIRRLFAAVSDALIEDADIGVGNRVLDVATGSGEPALRIAEVVGASGEVVGADPVAEMIESATRAAVRLSLENVRFEVAGVDNLPFPDGSFDAVVSRFGVMFFPAPLNGIREMLRVLKPGRKMSLAVWSTVDANPFHHCLVRVVERYFPEPAVPPDAPDAFRFAPAGRLKALMIEAGVDAVTERLVRFPIDVSMSVEEFWDLRLDMAKKLRQRFAAMAPDAASDFKREALDAFRAHSTAEGLSFPGEALIVSGVKRR